MEKARLLANTKPEVYHSKAPLVMEELKGQEEAVHVAALRALAALSTPEAVSALNTEHELPLESAEAMLGPERSHAVRHMP